MPYDASRLRKRRNCIVYYYIIIACKTQECKPFAQIMNKLLRDSRKYVEIMTSLSPFRCAYPISSASHLSALPFSCRCALFVIAPLYRHCPFYRLCPLLPSLRASAKQSSFERSTLSHRIAAVVRAALPRNNKTRMRHSLAIEL